MKTICLLLASLCIPACISAATPASEAVNPIANISQNPGLSSIFHTWGFIGDSLSSGEHESHNDDGSMSYNDLYEYSWGQRICAATGATGDNYSQGGETAGGWIEHFWDKPNNRNNNIDAKVSPKQAYIIALGVNDVNRGDEPGNVATDINDADYTLNANTFAGNYGGIIQRVKSIQPDAKFFVVTTPVGRYVSPAMNGVIRDIADHFDNTYLIDLEKYAVPYDEEFSDRYFMGGHMTAAGYQYTAWLMMTYIDHIVASNPAEFKQVPYIGTGLKY